MKPELMVLLEVTCAALRSRVLMACVMTTTWTHGGCLKHWAFKGAIHQGYCSFKGPHAKMELLLFNLGGFVN